MSEIDLNFDFNMKPSNLKERKKYAQMKTIMKCKIKNKYYNCKKRVETILNMIYNFASKDTRNIAIVVPNQHETIQKIINLIISQSNHKIIKMNRDNLKYLNTNIYLICPCHIEIGLDLAHMNIGLALLNGFYYHMFIRSLEYEELIFLIWNFKETKSMLVMVSDSNEIFDKEHGTLFKICDDLEICTSY
jgi:hypothetical protein